MANNPPIASGFNVTLQAGSLIPLSSLFTWFDADAGDSVVAFAVKDLTIGGGHLVFAPNSTTPVIEPDGQLFDQIPISQTGPFFPVWFYQVGSSGSVDQIEFSAIDNSDAYSQTVVTTVTASTSALPDLSMVGSLVLPDTTAAAGENLVFGFIWQFSPGTGPAATWNERVYLSADPVITSADTLLGNFPNTSPASPGNLGNTAGIVTLPATLAPGTYYIGAIIDATNQVNESNENNNATGVVAITVADTGYSLSPFAPTVNENAGTATFTVARSGALPAETLFVSTISSEGYTNDGDYGGLVNQPLAFSAGQLSQTLTVSLTDARTVEPDETFGLIVQRYADDPITTYLAKDRFTIHDIDTAATTYSISPGFLDDFNRADGLPGNGWTATAGSTVGLVVSNNVLTVPGGTDGIGGIFRPADLSGSISVSANVTQENGFGGLLRRYDTVFLFGNDGDLLTGYGLHIYRGDQNYSDSRVDLVYNGATLATAVSSFQFGAAVAVNATLSPDGSITGGILGDGNTFNFSFASRTVAFAGENFAILQSTPDSRSSVTTSSTIDNLSIVSSHSTSLGPVTVNESAGAATFVVTRSGSLSSETVFVSTAQTEGFGNDNDYTGLLNQALTFSSGQASQIVTVSIINDSVAETDEKFSLIVQRNAADPVSTFLAKSTFTIHDDDTFTISPLSRTMNENAGTVAFIVTRPSATDAETVYISTRQSEGFVNNNDYTPLVDQPLSFAPGETFKTVLVPIINDSVGESDETFGLVVLREAGDPAATPLAKSTFTIIDNDRPATAYSLSPGSTIVNENGGTINFTVTRSGGLPAETVYASTAQTEGYVNNFDYGGLANSAVTFAAGQASQTVTVAINDDAVAEADETFGLVLQRSASDPVSSFLAKSTFTIHDSDAAQIRSSVEIDSDEQAAVAAAFSPPLLPSISSIQALPKPVLENQGSVQLTINLSAPVTNYSWLHFSTADNTANGTQDYYPVSQWALFFPGQKTYQTTIGIRDDKVPEPTKSFFVRFDSSVGITIPASNRQTEITIADNDPPPSIGLGPAPSSLLFMAQLAEAAYHLKSGESGSVNNVSSTLFDKDYAAIQSQLQPVNLSGLAMSGGMFTNSNAAAFVGQNGDSLYIAFRGMNDLSLSYLVNLYLFQKTGNVQFLQGTDLYDAVLNQPGHYALLQPLIQAIDSYINTNHITKVYVTGHSLGGAMAEQFMEQHNPSLFPSNLFPWSHTTFQAVTFGSVGYPTTSNSLINTFMKNDDRILNILDTADIANTLRTILPSNHVLDGDTYVASLRFLNNPFALNSLDKSVPPITAHSMDLYREIANQLKSTLPLPGLVNHLAQSIPFSADVSLVEQAQGKWSVSITNPPSASHATTSFGLFVGTSADRGDAASVSGLALAAADLGSSSVTTQGGLFISTPGDDDFIGGDGINVYVTSQTNAPVIVDLSNGWATGDSIGADRLAGFQYVITGFGDDRITGDQFANIIDAGGGNDTLFGGDHLSLTAHEASIFRLYEATLARVPDNAGLSGWAAAMDGGKPLVDIAAGFVNSVEFQATYGALNNSQFVTLLYNNVLGRAPDADGLKGWVDALNGGSSRPAVVLGFSESIEFQSGTQLAANGYATTDFHGATYGQVYRLYGASLHREPDTAGFEGWDDALAGGKSLVDIAAGFVNSLEFQSIYGALDNTQYVTLLYNNVLGRAPDAPGLKGWVDTLNVGTSRASVLVGFSDSIEYQNNTADGLKQFMQHSVPNWSDTLDGGPGINQLLGGRGPDLFVFNANDHATDNVYGIELWDQLQFTNFGYAASSQPITHMTQSGHDVLFADQGTTVIFHQTDLATLSHLNYLV